MAVISWRQELTLLLMIFAIYSTVSIDLITPFVWQINLQLKKTVEEYERVQWRRQQKVVRGRFLLFLLTYAGVLHQEWSLPHKLEEMFIWHLDAMKFQVVAAKQPK